MVSVVKLMDGESHQQQRQGKGIKEQDNCKYLTEPTTKVFLPVVIWWTLGNEEPQSAHRRGT